MICLTTHDETVAASFARFTTPTGKPRAVSLVNIYPLNAHGGLIRLSEQRFTIGRDSHADLWIDDPSISRQHAAMEPRAEGLCIVDLGSTNGTYLNDERVTVAMVHAGDQVRFGNHIFKALGASDLEAQFLEAVYSRIVRDGLTGAYNKRYFLDALEREVKRTIRHHRPLAVAVLDLDYFKQVNDTHGHLVGDEVLKEASRRLMGIVRQDDIFARYGGEEFIAIFSETTLQQALIAAESFRHAIAASSFKTSAGELKVTVSVGVAGTLGNEPITPNELIAAADKCLYRAKHAGRNRVAS